jgi:hypothetical protein
LSGLIPSWSYTHGFKGAKASQGDGGAPQRLGAQGALQGDAFEAALLEAKHQLGRMSRGKQRQSRQEEVHHIHTPDTTKAPREAVMEAVRCFPSGRGMYQWEESPEAWPEAWPELGRPADEGAAADLARVGEVA